LLGALIHTAICWMLWIAGLFRVSGMEFIALFGVIWIGYLSYFSLLRTGLNKHFADSTLTIPILFWAVSAIMYTLALTNDLRAVLLMFYLLVLVFSAYYLDWRQYIYIILYGALLYLGVILFFMSQYPDYIKPKKEIIVFLCYIVISFSLAIICSKMNTLRKHLNEKNEGLELALKDTESLSVTDELTGVKNRRFILSILQQQRLLAERGQYIFAVCMLDIDHFKRVNDRHGHQVGDNFLIILCRKIEKMLRKMDFFARIGGEEFLFILPLVNVEQATQSAERIREYIEESDFSEVAPDLKATVSIGVTAYQWPEKIETTLARVDAALYAAKQAGRNKVIKG